MRLGAAAAGLCVLVAAGCARIEPPPGGPPDTAPPTLVSVFPESLSALPGFKGTVDFRFDEVVSEGSAPSNGSGNGDLERLVILSPTTRVPDVSWKRSHISVKPREGWQPGRVYRVELLPGVSDLRNNRSTTAHRIVTFTTGGPLPVDSLRGTVHDWTTGQPAARALVEALLLPDSLSYRMVTDSAGRFAAAPMPAGSYLVYGVLDQNNNHLREPREAFDSSTVTTPGTVLALWTFPHDTNPPRVRDASPTDSLTVRLQFSQPLLPGQPLDSAMVTVEHLPDSVRVAVSMLATQARFDSLRRAASGDTTARALPARVDSTTAGTRPPLSDLLILQLAQPMDTAGQYLVILRGIRNVTGVRADSMATVFKAPAPRPVPAARPDSAAPSDSLAPAEDGDSPAPAVPDSTASGDSPKKP